MASAQVLLNPHRGCKLLKFIFAPLALRPSKMRVMLFTTKITRTMPECGRL
jgi:hypothetical protein